MLKKPLPLLLRNEVPITGPRVPVRHGPSSVIVYGLNRESQVSILGFDELGDSVKLLLALENGCLPCDFSGCVHVAAVRTGSGSRVDVWLV